ncbi:protein NEGATIVE REGULATOR OF RESISTANCE-like [Triticum dicoccoides]|uniref:protein NEGATIVE REGULATOR OF RESISTANCE-like n=1 Tax=Triticum dicoccoides TaxID=85692 RepID=UPI00188FF798|nr:protein NEGATIVE REGULATOR OF RESISTANCE-like [Triticum dicoccoides]XP_044346317.1 protein NEGATIVE REGULATOR OF RESISTANCE-like [Triticum aestivum]
MDAPPPAAAAAKRKRSAADVSPASAGVDDVSDADVDDVSDADVDEFYAIISRMREQRDALRRRLVSGASAGARDPAARAPVWRPTFTMEDFAPPAPAPPSQQQHQLPVDEHVAENGTLPRRPVPALDLNTEPEPVVAGPPHHL